MNVINFSQNLSEIPVNLTGVQEFGVTPVACIQTNEVLASYHNIELIFSVIAFLLALDVMLTFLQWRDAQKKRLTSHDSD